MERNNSKNWKTFISPIGLMVLITISSSIPMDAAHSGKWYANLEPNFQNLLHIPLFALLSFFWAYSLKRRFSRNILISAIVITILFGCVDEFHQVFVPGRYAGLLDIMLNTAGAIIGVIAFKLISIKSKSDKQRVILMHSRKDAKKRPFIR
jgi:VanZ family protein